MLDHVLKLANISAPLLRHQDIHAARGERRHGLASAMPLPVKRKEVIGEDGNVLDALSQGRKLDEHYPQPIEQIFAKHSAGHRFLRIPIRGGYESHVDSLLSLTAHSPKYTVLEHAQQLRLETQGHFGDLVEEKRALVRDLEESWLVSVGARECALAVAEHL
jgi:hypothetical protein